MPYVIAIFLLLVATPASAQFCTYNCEDYWKGYEAAQDRYRYHHYHRTYRRTHDHYYRPRPVAIVHEHPHTHVVRPRVESWRSDDYRYSRRDRDRHQRCAGEISAVGTEHYSEDEAKRAAIKSWMAEVRHKLGTEMMDINNAEEMTFRCVVSSPGDRISDKIAQWTRGDLVKECRIVARPCRPYADYEMPREVRRPSTTGAIGR